MDITYGNIIDTVLDKLKIPRENIPENFHKVLELMFKTDEKHKKKFEIDRERLNIMLSYWHISPMNSEFFNHYFNKGNILEIEYFQNAIDQFIKDALWHFGSLERAYKTLSKEKDIESFFKKHEFNTNEFKDRLPWNLVEDIAPKDRGFLGYVSGQKTQEDKQIVDDTETVRKLVIEEITQNSEEYKEIDTNKVEKVLDKLSIKNPDIKKRFESFHKFKELANDNEIDLFSITAERTIKIWKEKIEKDIKKIEELKNIGKRNQEHYLRNIESIDVYVATSMRNDDEYIEMYKFVNTVFNDKEIKKLNLRYFDPTLCYCKSRIDKGIIECLLVRSSKVTIYCAQEGDTFGKDSELAATMAQGKPVIVYVPQVSMNSNKELYDKFEKRAKTFKEYHPLSLQVGLYDGVARGLIVVRAPEECSKMLYKILTNSLETKICYEEDGIVLRDMETNSVLRIMTGWDVLASCFWNQFDKTQNPKAGLTI